MLDTQNFIEERQHDSADTTPFETVLFDLLDNASFIGTVSITVIDRTTRIPARKIIDVAGLWSDTAVLFDGEVGGNMRVQIFVADVDLKVRAWDSLGGRAVQWRIVGNIDQTREVDG